MGVNNLNKKQLNLDVKEFKLILAALKRYRDEEIKEAKNHPDKKMQQYMIKEINEKLNPIIDKVKVKTI